MKTPNHLSGDSKKWWRKIASQFEFDDTAFLLLQTMFECYDEFKSARANLLKYGPLLKAKSGAIHRNPASTLKYMCMGTMALQQVCRPMAVPCLLPG